MDTIENNIPEDKIIVITKIPEYIKKAQHAYHNRNKFDPDYNKMKKENTNKWRIENRDKYNLSQKLRRAKKKEELKLQQQQLNNNTTPTPIENANSIESLIEPLNTLDI